MKNEPLTLCRHRWYAMLRLNPAGAQDFCPIWVHEAKALKTGKGMLELSFWDAHYPEGVQDKVYRLHVMRREAGFLLAERQDDKPKELVLFSEMTFEWVQYHLHETPTGDLQEWMDRKCGR